MRTQFYSDSGLPCYRCNATLFEYTADSQVSLVDIKCFTCYAVDVFSAQGELKTAAECSAAHRTSVVGHITPSDHEKAEWSRMAQAAYSANLNTIGHRYSGAASIKRGWQMPIKRFDELQTGYRLWLNSGFAEAAPFIHQHVA